MRGLLKTENLNAGYNKLHILFDVNFQAEKEKITTIVGPNGSGKSTFLKALMGLINIYSGKIIFMNEDITNLPPHKKVSKGIAYVPQTDNVFKTLTAEENLKLAGHDLDEGQLKDRLEQIFSIFTDVKSFLKKKVYQLSGGQRQMLAISLALMRKPQYILMDEPTAQLAPKIVVEVLKKIVELRDQLKLGVVLVEQNTKKALSISDTAYLFVSGRVYMSSSPQEMLSNAEIRKIFLGLGA